MTRRTRILALAAAAVVVLFLGQVLVQRLFLAPGRALEARAASYREKINTLESHNSQKAALLRRLGEFAARSFGTEMLRVQQAVRVHLKELLDRSQLTWDRLNPVGSGRRKRGVYLEIGQTVSAAGRLDQIVNFLYLLGEQPNLFRVEHLSLRPGGDGRTFALRLKYATLVLVPAKGETLTARAVVEGTRGDLNSGQRRQYDVVARRDVFRPYIQRQVAVRPPPPPPQEQEQPQVQVQPPAAPPPNLRVVSLTDWGDEQDVTVLNTATREVRTLHAGEELDGGTIVMVDYRELPHPDEPELLSGSRVILKFGREYWAVERGQFVSGRRPLRSSELPRALQARSSPARRTRPLPARRVEPGPTSRRHSGAAQRSKEPAETQPAATARAARPGAAEPQ
jgi:hypothetical protein